MIEATGVSKANSCDLQQIGTMGRPPAVFEPFGNPAGTPRTSLSLPLKKPDRLNLEMDEFTAGGIFPANDALLDEAGLTSWRAKL